MLLAMCKAEDIPYWLYPDDALEPGNPPGVSIQFPKMVRSDFSQLYAALELGSTDLESLIDQDTDCSCGWPHDAPDSVFRISPGLVDALARHPDHLRWRAAETWANARLGKRANNQEMAKHKELLKQLCELARKAQDSEKMIIIVAPPKGIW